MSTLNGENEMREMSSLKVINIEEDDVTAHLDKSFELFSDATQNEFRFEKRFDGYVMYIWLFATMGMLGSRLRTADMLFLLAARSSVLIPRDTH